MDSLPQKVLSADCTGLSLIGQRLLDRSRTVTRSYSMRGVMGAAARAVELARLYLQFAEPQGAVHDVQADPRFQERGVDLLWERPGRPIAGIEVKGDRQAHRRHYFF